MRQQMQMWSRSTTRSHSSKGAGAALELACINLRSVASSQPRITKPVRHAARPRPRPSVFRSTSRAVNATSGRASRSVRHQTTTQPRSVATDLTLLALHPARPVHLHPQRRPRRRHLPPHRYRRFLRQRKRSALLCKTSGYRPANGKEGTNKRSPPIMVAYLAHLQNSTTTANCIIIDHFSGFESGLVAPFLTLRDKNG